MVRIPKTGSTSIVKGLLGGMENAVETRYGEFPVEWQSLYSFAFIRNPFDRLVSAFVMFQKYPTNTEEERAFQANLTLDRMMDVVESPDYSPVLPDYFSRLKLHAIPMSHPFFCMGQVREIFRFEEFEDAYLKLSEKLRSQAKPSQAKVCRTFGDRSVVNTGVISRRRNVGAPKRSTEPIWRNFVTRFRAMQPCLCDWRFWFDTNCTNGWAERSAARWV